jgi:3-oxocholest-4-en-26-oate---CoA ligase
MEFHLADLFECVADCVGDREAVVCGDRRISYRELDRRATQFAHGLLDLGVEPGEHVGIYLWNSIEWLEAFFGCFKIRAVPVNINYRYVATELSYLFADADLAAVVYHREFAPQLAALSPYPPKLRLLIEVDDGSDADPSGRAGGEGTPVAYEKMLAAASAERDFPPRSADDPYLLYTGGTTGMPKGVVWRHEDIVFVAGGGGNPGGPPLERPEQIAETAPHTRCQRLRSFLPPDDPGPDEFAGLALGPLMHASGAWSAVSALLGGGKVVLYGDHQMDMAKVLDLVEREHVVMLTLVGDTSGRPLLEELGRGGHDTSSIRLLGSGGSILSPDVKERLLEAMPSVVAISESIGSSESPVQAVAIATPGNASASLQFAPRPGLTMVVGDDLEPVEPGSGEVGRLATTGRIPLGYYNDPVKTAATFVTIDGKRWVLPGDMACVEADGTIKVLGRGSLCINTGGEKVYPEEVEAVLKGHDKVLDAVVVGASDSQWGQRVVAVVSPVDPADPPTLEDLRAYCQAALAGYKAPRDIIVVDAVRRSPTGKADYRWAMDLAAGQ